MRRRLRPALVGAAVGVFALVAAAGPVSAFRGLGAVDTTVAPTTAPSTTTPPPSTTVAKKPSSGSGAKDLLLPLLVVAVGAGGAAAAITYQRTRARYAGPTTPPVQPPRPAPSDGWGRRHQQHGYRPPPPLPPTTPQRPPERPPAKTWREPIETRHTALLEATANLLGQLSPGLHQRLSRALAQAGIGDGQGPDAAPSDPRRSEAQRLAIVDALVSLDEYLSGETLATSRAALRQAGITILEPRPGEPFDPNEHTAVDSEVVTDRSLHRHIAQVERVGFADGPRRISDPQVIVYRFESSERPAPAPARPKQPRPGRPSKESQ